jgi:hypothetical protein
LKFTPIVKSTENRRLAQKPKFNVDLLDPYPIAFENWYNDNFRLRGQIMNFYLRLNVYCFGKSPIPENVIIGKRGWLFYAQNELKIYKGTDYFTHEELDSIRKELEYRQNYLSERHCKFYFAVAPIKVQIYPEYFPNNIYQFSKIGYAKQLVDYLNKYSSVKPIDLYHPLIKAKSIGRLYFKTDNHWNELGGLIASQALIKTISKDFKNIPVIVFSEFKMDSNVVNGGNLAGMLALSEEMQEMKITIKRENGFDAQQGSLHPYKLPENFKEVDYERVFITKNNSLPNILIIRDSFGSFLHQSFSEYFINSVYIFDAWEYKLNEDIVNTEKPDVCLLLVLETGVKALLKNQSRPK